MDSGDAGQSTGRARRLAIALGFRRSGLIIASIGFLITIFVSATGAKPIPTYLGRLWRHRLGPRQPRLPDRYRHRQRRQRLGLRHRRAFIRKFGSSGSEEDQFSKPRGLGFDTGNLWVADSGNDRVEGFNAEGEYLRPFGGPGNNGPRFAETQDVAIDPEANTWIADTGNNRIDKWQIPDQTEVVVRIAAEAHR